MTNTLKTSLYTETSPAAHRQYINAITVFTALEEARNKTALYSGGMFWKQQGGNTYLVRTATSNSQKSLGPRSDQTIAIFDKFIEAKKQIESRVKDLQEELVIQQKLNRIYSVGHAPKVLIDVLNAIYQQGLSSLFTMVGSCSMYAYETAATVRFTNPDMLSSSSACFIVNDNIQNTLILGTLKKADKTFSMLDRQPFTACNSKGFTVTITTHENIVTTPLKPFSVMLVSKSGHMARMHAFAPGDFVRIKFTLGGKEDRDSLKRARDKLQAETVKMLIEEYLPMHA